MKKLICALGLSVLSLSVNAATSKFGLGCGVLGTVGGGTAQAIVSSPTGGYALILVDGSYCIIQGATPGEVGLIRSVALESMEQGNQFYVDVDTASGNIDVYNK